MYPEKFIRENVITPFTIRCNSHCRSYIADETKAIGVTFLTR